MLLLPKSLCKKSKREYGRSFSRRQLPPCRFRPALIAGWGDAEDEPDRPASVPPVQEEPQQTETAAAADLKDTSRKPEIAKPTGTPPRRLQTEDIVKGKGRR